MRQWNSTQQETASALRFVAWFRATEYLREQIQICLVHLFRLQADLQRIQADGMPQARTEYAYRVAWHFDPWRCSDGVRHPSQQLQQKRLRPARSEVAKE